MQPAEREIAEISAIARDAARLQAAGCTGDEIALEVLDRIGPLDAAAWAAAEDELLAAGIRREIVQALSARRIRAASPAAPFARASVARGHPIDMLFRENDVIRELIADLLCVDAELTALPFSTADARPHAALRRLAQLADALERTKAHHARVLDVLLPQLESRGLRGVSRTLWAYCSGVRSRVAALKAAIANSSAGVDALRTAVVPIVSALIKSLQIAIRREEQVLAPLLLRILFEQDWAAVDRDSRACGPFLVDAADEHVARNLASPSPSPGGSVRFPAGQLSHEQLRAIVAVLPVDLTFVDASDAVCMFTETPDRVFPRSRAVLGRSVQQCHPPKSIRRVQRILSDFRDGSRDVAEFWLTHEGRFIHVRYFAVRDPAGEYLGTLEVAQDLTRIRSLAGEQRLLPDDAGSP